MFFIKFINLVYIDFAQNKKTKIFIFKNESSRILSQMIICLCCNLFLKIYRRYYITINYFIILNWIMLLSFITNDLFHSSMSFFKLSRIIMHFENSSTLALFWNYKLLLLLLIKYYNYYQNVNTNLNNNSTNTFAWNVETWLHFLNSISNH